MFRPEEAFLWVEVESIVEEGFARLVKEAGFPKLGPLANVLKDFYRAGFAAGAQYEIKAPRSS